MRIPALLLIGVLPLTAAAAGICERADMTDPKFPGGLGGVDGDYRVVGRAPGGDAYFGTLTIALGKTSYTLTRRVGETVVTGEGRIEFCGVDRVRIFNATYDTEPTRTELTCSPGMDGDNYNRISCRTRREGDQGGIEGLEAMFENH